MESILRGYSVSDPTWIYLSLMLIIAVFFRFTRLWSIRNLDIVMLLGLSPGLLLVREQIAWGYLWLMAGTGLFLIRVVVDPLLRRRPKMAPNLNVPGLAFLCFCAFAFLTTKVFTDDPHTASIETVRQAENLLQMEDTSNTPSTSEDLVAGPATRLLTAPVLPLSNAVARGGNGQSEQVHLEEWAARIMAVVAHLAVITGLFVLALWHFKDWSIGMAMATIYLLLPCTAFDVGKVIHVLPAALIVWALAFHHRPTVAGILLGLACGTLFFPIFMLPIWAAYYGRKRALRFTLALGLVGAVLIGSLIFTSADAHSFTRQTIGSIDWSILQFQQGTSAGLWSMVDSAYRLPMIVGFGILLLVLTIWPRKKTLEQLVSHSAAVVLAIQFWYPHEGGVYLLWYLPLLLIVVFRPHVVRRPAAESPATNGNGAGLTVARPAHAELTAATRSLLF